MDEMIIKTNFLKGIIKSIVKKQIKKAINCDIDIDFGDMFFKQSDGSTSLEITNIKIGTRSNDILKLLKDLGVL